MVPAPLDSYPVVKYLEENGVDTNKLGVLLLEYLPTINISDAEDEFQAFTYLETIKHFLHLIRPEKDVV